jgi:alpha-tubulin suppressor-like RCC1 family protein
MTARTRIVGFGGLLPALFLASCVLDRTDEEIGRSKIRRISVDAQFPLVVGESRTLPAAIYADADGNPTGVPFNGTWLSRDPGVASVSPNGSLTAGLTPGSTYIVVTDGSLTDSTLVTVTADFFVWPDTMRLIPGATHPVNVLSHSEISGVRGVAQTSWETLDPSVATVSGEGLITAAGTGETSIVAHRGTFSMATTVRVVKYPRQLTFTDFGIGPGGVCALESDGTPWCWGLHQPVDGTGTDRCGAYPAVATRCSASPIQMSTMSFSQVISSKLEAGSDGMATGPFALTADGHFYRLGQSGPTLLGSGMTFQTALGGSPYCGVAADMRGYCWGYNVNGEMGIGTTQPQVQTSSLPVEVGGGIQWKQFVHAVAMCGLAVDETAYCWGSNVNYETGTGTDILACSTGCANNPRPVKGGFKFTQLVAGTQEVCGTISAGTLYCWSRSWTDNGGPVAVPGAPANMTLFGNSVICGIRPEGDVYCMRFPNEPPRQTFLFAKLALPFKVKKIVTGDGIACALSADDGRLYCWGSSNLGGGLKEAAAAATGPVEVWGQRP